MDPKQVGFFQDDLGNNSQMRLMSFMSLLASFFFGYMAVIQPNNPNSIYVYFGFLLGAFAPKVVQKFAEAKIPCPPSKE